MKNVEDIFKQVSAKVENGGAKPEQLVEAAISDLQKALTQIKMSKKFGKSPQDLSIMAMSRLTGALSNVEEVKKKPLFTSIFEERDEYNDKLVEVVEREVKPLDVTLNDGQQQAFDKAIKFCQTENKQKFFGIFGFAGTGKSFVMQEINHALQKVHGESLKVAMCGPTHRSVAVLAEMAHSYPTQPDFGTIHSMLAIKRVLRDGEEFFEPDKYAEQTIYNYGLVVIDECSMIGPDLWEHIERAALSKRGPKIILMGDKLQLPPVGYEMSPSFYVDDYHMLDEVVRFGGVINNAVNETRLSIGTGSVSDVVEGSDSKGRVVAYDGYKPWIKEFVRCVKDDNIDAKALAYTNNRVNKINKYVRQQIYGEGVEPFIEGETLVAIKTITDKYEQILLHTGDECVVQSAERSINFDVDCWKLTIRNAVTWELSEIYTTDEDQEKVLNAKLNKLAKRKKWGQFWPMKEGFARLRPPFCTTCHKSQGSTYDRVFVDRKNVMTCSDDSTFQSKLLYVAFSRAAKELHVM